MRANYIFVLALFLATALPCFGFSYTITFVGYGDSETVESVEVENLATGKKVTVPAGNSLLLTDNPSAVGKIDANKETIHVEQASDGTSVVSFYAKQAGVVLVDVFSFDGKKVKGASQSVAQGSNAFELTLPRGAYVVKVSGQGYSYSAKFINKKDAQSEASIVYSGESTQIAAPALATAPVSKVAEEVVLKDAQAVTGVTEMLYAEGQRLLLTGKSGNCRTILSEVPIDDAELEFYFAECKDGSGNYYPVALVGTQVWMAEDLRTTKYDDGSDILQPKMDLWQYVTGAACIKPEGSPTTFYNWFAANAGYDPTTGGTGAPTGEKTIAPIGFKVPSKGDVYNGLANAAQELAAEDDKFEGYLYTLCGITDWAPVTDEEKAGAPGYDLKSNNVSGLGFLPTGYVDSQWHTHSSVMPMWVSTQWTATAGEIIGFYNDQPGFIFYDTIKESGSVVRCFKEAE